MPSHIRTYRFFDGNVHMPANDKHTPNNLMAGKYFVKFKWTLIVYGSLFFITSANIRYKVNLKLKPQSDYGFR